MMNVEATKSTKYQEARKMNKARLYDANGKPVSGFNGLVAGWLEGNVALQEHNPPAAFKALLNAYNLELDTVLKSGVNRIEAHRALLSNLTKMMFGTDISPDLKARLSTELINPTGFRRTIDQGAAKNAGENFINMLVWALANLLQKQDDVLVDKGLPRIFKDALTLERPFIGVKYKKNLSLTIEGDLVVFSRKNPFNAVIVSAKTRLKEVFHIATMWKLFFDILEDRECLDKWALKRIGQGSTKSITYVFATADMIPAGGRKTQGPDVEREQPRNLIALDASFFDYVFVSKQGIEHVANSLKIGGRREALFHEMGCIIDLIDQKFKLGLTQAKRVV